MNNNLHIYQFEVKIAAGGCGTTSYATVKKTVLAQNEKEAKEKLHDELALTVSTINLIAKEGKKSQSKASIEHMQGYLNSTSQTDDGMVYRKENWEKADPDEIIYIGENGLCDIMQYVENGEAKTDDELVELNIASTKNSIRENIKEVYPDATDEWIDKHDLITRIVQCCSWEYATTIIDRMEEAWDDIWDDYPE